MFGKQNPREERKTKKHGPHLEVAVFLPVLIHAVTLHYWEVGVEGVGLKPLPAVFRAIAKHEIAAPSQVEAYGCRARRESRVAWPFDDGADETRTGLIAEPRPSGTNIAIDHIGESSF